MKNLNQLFEKNKINGIEIGFDELANYLINECILAVNENEYRIAEIEFYYFDKDNHPDVFTHRNECQKKSNLFYFHTAGVDITFGNVNYYGGILIRSIINLQTKEYIIGPNKVAYKEFLKCDTENQLIIKLKEKKQKINDIYFKSCRIFSKKYQINDELEKEYIFKPYRYILNDEKLILNLLNFSESHFLAVFLKNQNFSEKISNTIKNKINYINSDSFLKSQTEKRNLFKTMFKNKINS